MSIKTTIIKTTIQFWFKNHDIHFSNITQGLCGSIKTTIVLKLQL